MLAKDRFSRASVRTVPSGLTAVTFRPAAIAALIARVIAAWVYGFCFMADLLKPRTPTRSCERSQKAMDRVADAKGEKTINGGSFRLAPPQCCFSRGHRSVPRNNAAIDLTLSPIHPAAGQLVAGLERPDVLLAVAGGLGVQWPDDLGAVAAVASPMGHPGLHPAETVGWTVRIVAFVPGVADQDELAADVAGGKLGVAAAAVVESFSGPARKPLAPKCVDDAIHHDSSLSS